MGDNLIGDDSRDHGTTDQHSGTDADFGTVLRLPAWTHFQGWKCVRAVQPLADNGHIHALPKVNVSLPTQAHDLLCTASLHHSRTLFSPCRGMKILSQDLDQDLGRVS